MAPQVQTSTLWQMHSVAACIIGRASRSSCSC